MSDVGIHELLDEPVLARIVVTIKDMKALDRRGDPDWLLRLRAPKARATVGHLRKAERDPSEPT